MSRLLVLLPGVPSPADSGARIRNQGLLRLLCEECEVDAIAFGEPESQSELARLVQRATIVTAPRPRSGVERTVDLAASQLPDMAQRLWSLGFEDALKQALALRSYDAVQAEGIEMARHLERVPPSARVYDAHNAEFLLQRRLVAEGPLAARVYSRLQWRRLERFERRVVQRSRLTLAVSNHDANQLLALAGPGANVRVVPNGIDVAAYPFRAPPTGEQSNLLFLGKLDFRPNREAVQWFIDEVLGRLPRARLFAVGAAPPPWLVSAGQHDDRIAVTGYVRDERPYFARSAALILPLRTGAGSRLKALVAMASGLPIVSTRLGMEGLEAEPGVHYLPAESAEEWVSAVDCLLRDASARERLARSARSQVEQRYDWSVIRGEARSAYDWLTR
jgi:glycosyltransferase involved in cell wall biosynthesis